MKEGFIPNNLAEALSIRSVCRCTVFAGGTDLMVRYRSPAGLPAGITGPVLYIGHLPELGRIEKTPAADVSAAVVTGSVGADSWLSIGSCVTLGEIAANPSVPAPLRESVRLMAGPGIRNTGTIGGNICNASPAGDTLPFLYAVDAVLVLSSASGDRSLPIDTFIAGPGKTILRPDEILTRILIPSLTIEFHRYRKVGTRKANALSKTSFMGLSLKGGDIRIAFGACAPRIVRNHDAEEYLMGMKTGNCHDADRAVRMLYGPLLVPIDDQRSTAAYRKETALRLASAFIQELCSGGKG